MKKLKRLIFTSNERNTLYDSHLDDFGYFNWVYDWFTPFYLNRKDTLGHKIMYQVVSIVSSVCRSIPFIILMILIIPFTKALLGTFLGTQVAIPALVISRTVLWKNG